MTRSSYIDPRVFDRFDGGLTIGGVIPDFAEAGEGWPAVQRSVEEGVIDLIAERRGLRGRQASGLSCSGPLGSVSGTTGGST